MTVPIFILAGELSGDQLAAQLMHGIEAHYGVQQWVGVGDAEMAKIGLDSWATMDQLSIIGFGAALKAYPKLSRLMDNIIDQIIKTRPKLIITVDAKGFSLRLAARLKKRMQTENWYVPIIHVVAPTVWAWGEWRKHSVAKAVDALLCLFPFEPDYFTPLGVQSRFIGHPDAQNEALIPVPVSDVNASNSVVLLPGSRRSEISRILPRMLGAAELLLTNRPDLNISLVTVPRMEALVMALMEPHQDLNIEVTSERSRFYKDVKNANAILAASGTVTLQTALMGAPGIATYVVGPLSAVIGRHLVNMDNVILPNAILGREIYPFLFQQAASPMKMAKEVNAILDNPKAKTVARDNAVELRAKLGGTKSFADNVATAFSPYIN